MGEAGVGEMGLWIVCWSTGILGIVEQGLVRLGGLWASRSLGGMLCQLYSEVLDVRHIILHGFL